MNSQDKFTFWRVLVALTHVDGVVDLKEKEFFIDKFDASDLSQEERRQLVSELDSPQDPIKLFRSLTKPSDKVECLAMVNMLFASDNNYCELERNMYENLLEAHTNDVDVDSILEEISNEFEEKTELENSNKSRWEKAIEFIVSLLP